MNILDIGGLISRSLFVLIFSGGVFFFAYLFLGYFQAGMPEPFYWSFRGCFFKKRPPKKVMRRFEKRNINNKEYYCLKLKYIFSNFLISLFLFLCIFYIAFASLIKPYFLSEFFNR